MSGTSESTSQYAAVVVGAGPAGVCCVGNLLERSCKPIFWVDHEFNGGRINKLYREVPSNTTVGMFLDYATALPLFRKIVSGVCSKSGQDEPINGNDSEAEGQEDKLRDLRQLPHDKGCQLSYPADMLLMLTEELKRTPGVHPQRGELTEAILDESTSKWTVEVHAALQSDSATIRVKTQRLILCTGAAPSQGPLPKEVEEIPRLYLDVALSPSALSKSLSLYGAVTVAVIGASHSAILVLRNLYRLASSSKQDIKIRWFTRHPLRYAEYKDGWILRDNTGLKGEAAAWAKENLEPEVFSQSDVSNYISTIRYDRGDEESVFKKHLPGSDLVCQAIGYKPNPLPTLKTSTGEEIQPSFDQDRGSFKYAKKSASGCTKFQGKLPGMYGAGIAWPERVKDPYGNVEDAVGFWKFMTFVKKVSPEWN